jgi:hypothetical protein
MEFFLRLLNCLQATQAIMTLLQGSIPAKILMPGESGVAHKHYFKSEHLWILSDWCPTSITAILKTV